MKKFNLTIPSNSISYLTICGGIIVLIVLLIILPFYRYNSNRAREIKKIETSIEEQKGLAGIYQVLKSASGKEDSYALPNPVKTKLPRQDVDKFQDAFRSEAGKSGLMTMAMMPDIKTIAGGSSNLLYDVTLRGEFAGLRKLLVRLGAVSYIDKIDEIHLRQFSDSMEFKMKIWISLSGEAAAGGK